LSRENWEFLSKKQVENPKKPGQIAIYHNDNYFIGTTMLSGATTTPICAYKKSRRTAGFFS